MSTFLIALFIGSLFILILFVIFIFISKKRTKEPLAQNEVVNDTNYNIASIESDPENPAKVADYLDSKQTDDAQSFTDEDFHSYKKSMTQEE